MKYFNFFLLIMVTVLLSNISHASDVDNYSKTIKMFKKSPETKKFFDNAYGFALFPVIGKGGAIIGGAFGKGRVYRGNKITGKTSLVHLSIGFQLGGQSFSEIIFLQDKRAYNEFISGTLEFDAKASAVAITAGVQAQVGTTGKTAGASAGPKTGRQAKAKYVKGMAVFIHAIGGFMYEAAIGGQKFSFEPL